MIDLSTAEHEAAHIVVGLAVGLRLKRAVVVPSMRGRDHILGYTWFAGRNRRGLALSLMYCAGIVWESRPDGEPETARIDRRLARQYFISQHDLNTGVRLAAELLRGRRRAHARVTAALCELGRLDPKDLQALVHGP